MNFAPVRGFEVDVGSRTDVRIVNDHVPPLEGKELHGGDVIFQNERTSILVVWGPHCMLLTKRFRLLAERYSPMKVYTINKQQSAKMRALFESETKVNIKKTNAWLSTGWFTFDVVLRACDSITVYGLAPKDYCNNPQAKSVRYHYYGKSLSECKYVLSHHHHKFIDEKIVYARWALERNITFKAPPWS